MCRLLWISDSEMRLFPEGPGEGSFTVPKGSGSCLSTLHRAAQESLRTGIREVMQVSMVSEMYADIQKNLAVSH